MYPSVLPMDMYPLVLPMGNLENEKMIKLWQK